MDFLDPKRKQAHHRRLLIGYLLMAVALAMATWLLLNSSLGYWVDPKTGNIIQNGTVFVDSVPGGSGIELGGVMQGNKTAARLTLPGGHQYTIKLTNNGYRDWIRTFSLEGGQIERLTYPLLIPTKLTATDVQLYATVPGLSSQSPDRRWLLVQQPGNALAFEKYDLGSPGNSPQVLTIPASLLTDPTKPSVVSVVEWSNNNRHALISRAYNGTREFIILDTENIGASININTRYSVTPSDVHLRDKKADQFYVYVADGGVLRSADAKNTTLSAPLLAGVAGYKTYGSDLILYVTKEGAEAGKANFRIRENDKTTYLLKAVPEGSSYMMDIAEYDGTPYYVVGSNTSDAVFVYRDPLSVLKSGSKSLIVSQVLRVTTPQFVSFASSSQFIAVQNGNELTVLDLEGDRQFKISLKHSLKEADKLAWVDGHRLVFNDGGISYMIDFDGSNEQTLIPVSGAGGPYFSPDFKTMFTVAPSTGVTGRFAFTQASLVTK